MKSRALPIAVCYVLVFICAIIIIIIGPLIKEMTETFSLNMVESGFLLTAMFIGLTVFSVAGGVLADRFGKKRVLTVSLAILAGSLLAISFSTSFTMACILMVLVGGGAGILESMSNALLNEIGQEKGNFHVNMVQAVFGLGAFAGPFLAGALGASWQTIYIALAVLAAVAAILLGSTRLPKLPVQERLSFRAFRRFWTDPLFIMLCVCLILYTGSEAGAWGWMATFLKANLAFNKFNSDLAVGVFWLAMVVGRVVVTALLRKVKKRTFMLILAFPSAAATLGSAFVTTPEMGWVVAILLGLCYSSIWQLIVSYGSERYTRHTGTVFATFIASGGVGMSIIPLLMGTVGQYVNIKTAMALPAVFFLAIGIIFIFIERVRSKQPEPQQVQDQK